MRKFIEVEMEKVKGTAETEEEEDEGPKYLSPEDAALQVSHLTISQSHTGSNSCPRTLKELQYLEVRLFRIL